MTEKHLTAGTLLTAREVAQLLGVRIKRVYELPIKYVRISPRTKRWQYKDVLNWIDNRKQ